MKALLLFMVILFGSILSGLLTVLYGYVALLIAGLWVALMMSYTYFGIERRNK